MTSCILHISRDTKGRKPREKHHSRTPPANQNRATTSYATQRYKASTCKRLTSLAKMKAPITLTLLFFRCSTNNSCTYVCIHIYMYNRCTAVRVQNIAVTRWAGRGETWCGGGHTESTRSPQPGSTNTNNASQGLHDRRRCPCSWGWSTARLLHNTAVRACAFREKYRFPSKVSMFPAPSFMGKVLHVEEKY